MLYVVLGHRIANTAADGTASSSDSSAPADAGVMSGIDQLGAAMLIAAVVATPFGVAGAAPTFVHPNWLLWGIGVGVCSSVIPYVTDQLAMARLPRSTFALMLAILPATATGIGLIVLGQVPPCRTWRASPWSSPASPCTTTHGRTTRPAASRAPPTPRYDLTAAHDEPPVPPAPAGPVP